MEQLIAQIEDILVTRTTRNWPWMWGQSQSNLEYYFIFEICNNGFKYQDIDDFRIEIKLENDQYRIDLKIRYGKHHFWLFEAIDLPVVGAYILDLIGHQYKSIMKRQSLFEVSGDASYKRAAQLLEYRRDLKLQELSF